MCVVQFKDMKTLWTLTTEEWKGQKKQRDIYKKKKKKHPKLCLFIKIIKTFIMYHVTTSFYNSFSGSFFENTLLHIVKLFFDNPPKTTTYLSFDIRVYLKRPRWCSVWRGTPGSSHSRHVNCGSGRLWKCDKTNISYWRGSSERDSLGFRWGDTTKMHFINQTFYNYNRRPTSRDHF